MPLLFVIANIWPGQIGKRKISLKVFLTEGFPRGSLVHLNPGTSQPKSRDILAILCLKPHRRRLAQSSVRDIPGSGSGISKRMVPDVQARFAQKLSVAMPADSRREKIFDFVREFAVKYFRIVPVRDSTQQNKA